MSNSTIKVQIKSIHKDDAYFPFIDVLRNRTGTLLLSPSTNCLLDGKRRWISPPRWVHLDEPVVVEDGTWSDLFFYRVQLQIVKEKSDGKEN